MKLVVKSKKMQQRSFHYLKELTAKELDRFKDRISQVTITLGKIHHKKHMDQVKCSVELSLVDGSRFLASYSSSCMRQAAVKSSQKALRQLVKHLQPKRRHFRLAREWKEAPDKLWELAG